MIIKKAILDNLDLVETIYHDSIDWLDSQNIHQWQKDIYPTRDTAEKALKKDCLYCCFVDERMVGTFIINEIQPPQYQTLNWKYNHGRAMVLHTLVVKPCEAGQGIGRSVLKYVIDQAQQNEYACIRLDAFPDNRIAIRLYLSFGFEYVGKVFFDIKEPSYEWYDCYEKKIAEE
jgi:ribosomal protein S18 acetylase RimI-like enzyme